jgi:hypothetical protein
MRKVYGGVEKRKEKNRMLKKRKYDEFLKFVAEKCDEME